MNKFKQDLKVNRRNPLILSALATYRFGNWVTYDFKVPVLKQLLKFIYAVMDTLFVRIVNSGELPARANIGGGLFLPHGLNGVVVHWDAIIGCNATIYHQVTIGAKDPSTPEEYGPPTIGDHAFIGAGAKIIGKITLGNHVMVGANAVVLKDIPDYSTAVGVPAIVKPRSVAKVV
ncbi:serine O-acetyltransferase [Cohnella sp. GbtcB17]|uniref:serine O-acetyltransferase n=1 Tax=Cohnella sp. GbtcB17 TaxID=2824762 RepID=UPI001C2FC4E3|nr:serine acetyltransferase [Cohnella sp. GbtcB17]